MIIAFYTLGCKVNQYETEALREVFEKNGWTTGSFDEPCDAYVINTCTVTAISDRKSRQMIRRAARLNPDAVIAVCGCYAETAPQDIEKIKGVDIIGGTKDKLSLYDKICERLGLKLGIKAEDMEITCFEGKTRAVIKIEDGCDNFCSYCIIPYARGRIKSRPSDAIVAECQRIAEAGYKEVVLAGIHVCSYGKDTGSSLIELLERLDKETDIERIRLSSIEPNAFFDGFIPRLKELKKLCPHFHISLQSGCDETLRRMNRRYSSAEYKKVADELCEAFPGCAITTDVIVGFPGETEEEFNKSKAFIESVPFYKIHTFKYSVRKGTAAAQMPDKISPELQERRSKEIIALSERKEKEFRERLKGFPTEVLIEKKDGDLYMGHAGNYLPVYVKSDKDIINQIIKTNFT